MLTRLYEISQKSLLADFACLQAKGARKGADQNRTGVSALTHDLKGSGA